MKILSKNGNELLLLAMKEDSAEGDLTARRGQEHGYGSW